MLKEATKPCPHVLYSYATVQIFALAAQAAGSTKIAAVAKQMHGMVFHTVLGDIRFDGKGDSVGAGYVVWRWQDGSYKMVEAK